jgi:hypothetical protein
MSSVRTVAFVFLLSCTFAAYCQITGNTPGVVPFGSYTDDPTGVVNAANLVIHSVIPVRHKGTFVAELQREGGSLWYSAPSGGSTVWLQSRSIHNTWGGWELVTPTRSVPVAVIHGQYCPDLSDTAYTPLVNSKG